MRYPTKQEMYAALEERHGKQLQEKFSQASVAICGLGGLGSNVAIHLVRAGVGKLFLLDFDQVDITNLNRQQYFPDQLGEYKTDALKHTLSRIAPYCQIMTKCVKLNEQNIPELLAEFPIICEAFDKPEQKAMLVNTVLEKLPETFLIASSGMAGLDTPNTIRTRKITPKFYLCGDEENGIESGIGLISARVAVCAAHQATTILRIISGENSA